jgi:purine-binding chemotaxis protein CheW
MMDSSFDDVPVIDSKIDDVLLYDNNEQQYLAFEMNQELYCVNILKVKEIREWKAPSLLPNAPQYIKGVINIRGDIVPVVDLRMKFGFAAEYTATTIIIVLDVCTLGTTKTIGMVVDSVYDVLQVDDVTIKDVSASSGHKYKKYVKGLCQWQDRLVTALDIDEALNLSEVDDYYRSFMS